MAMPLIIVGFVMLIGLLIRLIQPELIYSVRQSLIDIGTNKAMLDYEAKRRGTKKEFVEQLKRDLRYETRAYDEKYILQRVNKIRQLYRLLDRRGKMVPRRQIRQDICVVELAGMLRSVGRRAQPREEVTGAVVGASGVLAFLANAVRDSEKLPPLKKESEIENWFVERPISIEQMIELLIAAVFALVYRQRATDPDTVSANQTPGDLGVAIAKVERQLRWLVRRRFETEYVSWVASHEGIREVLGDPEYQACIAKMQSSRQQSASMAVEFVDFLFLAQLGKLVMAKWSLFEKVFPDQAWLSRRLEYLLAVPHGRPVAADVSHQALAYCRDLGLPIAEYMGTTRAKAAGTAAAKSK